MPANVYDAQSQRERTQLSQAVNQAIGRTDHLNDPEDDVLSKAAGLSGAPGSQPRRQGQKLDPLAPSESKRQYGSQGQGARSMADVLSTKIEQDEEEEMEIHNLQKQLASIQDALTQVKFKYEKRQLYELETKEKALQERLGKLRELQKERYSYDSLN